jgi:hypothetical protein
MSLLSPHRQRAMHLYRHALKTCLDWSGNRAQWYVRVSTVDILLSSMHSSC